MPVYLGTESLPVTLTVTTAPTVAYTVGGVVIDVMTKSPIRNAQVSLDDRTAYTDAEGKFEFTDVAQGVYTLTVQADGYRPYSAKLTVDRDIYVTIELTPIVAPPVPTINLILLILTGIAVVGSAVYVATQT